MSNKEKFEILISIYGERFLEEGFPEGDENKDYTEAIDALILKTVTMLEKQINGLKAKYDRMEEDERRTLQNLIDKLRGMLG